MIKKEEPKLKNYNKSNVTYNIKHSFYKFYRDSKKFDNLSFKSKYSFLHEFFKYLNEFKKLKTRKQESEKKNKTNVHHTLSESFNELLEIYFDECCYLSHAKGKKMDPKYKPKKIY